MAKSVNFIGGVATTICLLLGSSAMAQNLSVTDFSAHKTRIKANYKTEKDACDSLSSNAKDICIAQANGKESVALAELDNRYDPSPKNQYRIHIAKGEAAYGVAIEKCDDLSGNPKDVCVKEAQAALTSAKADATVEIRTGDVNANARSEKNEVRADAAADKRAAALSVAQEKCDALASTAKDKCLAAAKAKFGKL